MKDTPENGRRSFCRLLLSAGTLEVCDTLFATPFGPTQEKPPWSKATAWSWYKKLPWLVGCNYIPATAINSTEMWQESTFDPATIQREMRAAASAGLNCARVFMQYLVWENDPRGLKRRMDRFMQIASQHGIKIMWVLFDDCAFGGEVEPFLGKQPPVIPGEYANGWTPSPGPSRVLNRADWPKLRQYVHDLIGAFRSDRRVLAWDLYNEPGNSHMGNKSLPLLTEVFGWGRQARPSQPLTVAIWDRGLKQVKEIDATILANSDVITFHNYWNRDVMLSEISDLTKTGRPLICSEWMARETGSTIANILPVFYQHRVGAIFWGLVNGKTQTNYHWGSKAGSPPPALWQHDIFHGNLTPYNPKEIALLKKYVEMSRSRSSR